MVIGSKEHTEILNGFEKAFNYLNLDKEKDKNLWKSGQVYEHGETNKIYKAFISGYALGRCNYLN